MKTNKISAKWLNKVIFKVAFVMFPIMLQTGSIDRLAAKFFR